MSTTTQTGPDLLRTRSQLLTKQIAAANKNLAPLLLMLPALETQDNYLRVEALNKFSDECISAVSISGLLMDILRPSLREILESKIEVIALQRNDFEKELQAVQLQLKALGLEDQGVRS